MKLSKSKCVLLGKLGIAMLGLLLLVLGSEILSDRLLGDRRMVPAPLSDVVPYDLVGTPQGIWGGDNFQLVEPDGKLHFVILEGMSSPKPGQPYFAESRQTLIQLINNKKIRVRVLRRDEQQREIGWVFAERQDLNEHLADQVSEAGARGDLESVAIGGQDSNELDVGYQVIWMGMGWYNGSDFAMADRYRAGQATARKMKKGLWSQPAPSPPWNFGDEAAR